MLPIVEVVFGDEKGPVEMLYSIVFSDVHHIIYKVMTSPLGPVLVRITLPYLQKLFVIVVSNEDIHL